MSQNQNNNAAFDEIDLGSIDLRRKDIFQLKSLEFENGGSAKFEQAIDHLLEDGRLKSGDTLFLAFDNTMRSFNDSRMSYCESCYAVHKLGVSSPDLAKTRLAYLYANSLFQSVFSPLGLRVTTDT